MKNLISIVALVGSLAGVVACGGGSAKDPKEACETIYANGGQVPPKPYTGDKVKFMETCTKASADTLRCLQLPPGESFKDDSCGPGHGKVFSESMDIMRLGGNS